MTEENIEQVSGSALKRFFGYVWGMIVAPIFTMDRLTEEPKKNWIAIFAIIFSNIIVILIIALIIYHRNVALYSGKFRSPSTIYQLSAYIFISINQILGVITILSYIFSRDVDNKQEKIHVLFSYLLFIMFMLFVLLGCIITNFVPAEVIENIIFHNPLSFLFLAIFIPIYMLIYELINPFILIGTSSVYMIWLAIIMFLSRKNEYVNRVIKHYLLIFLITLGISFFLGIIIPFIVWG